MSSVYVARPSGLLAPFDVPELTLEQAIERNWERRDGGSLLQPKADEYLPTYPYDRPWGYAPAPIPWGGPSFSDLTAFINPYVKKRY